MTLNEQPKSYRLVCVVGARPNFMKIAPIIGAIQKEAPQIDVMLVHTGQHYDEAMKHRFFQQLGIPEPDIDLEVGSGSHSVQTAEIMKRFEPVLLESEADGVLVVGDVNSTIACALVAAKNHVPVVHVEAGLRSGDRDMPEEVNRVLTDQLSDLLYTTERNAEANLNREGIGSDRIRFVGNVMIDTLMEHREQAPPAKEIISSFQTSVDSDANYALMTLHRPSNVDDHAVLKPLLETLGEISKKITLVFPMHPRTQERVRTFGLQPLIDNANIIPIDPVGYLEMLGLMSSATLVLTDSGGIQEETTALGVPCITLRENTERPITVAEGTNTIVGTDADLIRKEVDNVLVSGGKSGRRPELWDGKAAVRIAQDLSNWLQSRAIGQNDG